MIVFKGRAAASNERDHKDTHALMIDVTDKLDKHLRNFTCPHHPHHNHEIFLNFLDMEKGFGIEIMNSCCQEFPVLLSKKINEALSKK